MRRPTATTVSAARMKAPRNSSSSWIDFSAASALARASRLAQARGNSPRFGVSSTSDGRSASGSMPAWLSRLSRRGEPEARTNLGRPSMRDFCRLAGGAKFARNLSEGAGGDNRARCALLGAPPLPRLPARRRHPGKSLADAQQQGVADVAIGLQFLLAVALGSGGILGRPVFDVGRHGAGQFQRLVMGL